MTLAEARDRIDAINAILAEGVRAVRHASGRMVEYDLETLHKERDQLQAAVARATRDTSRGVYHA